MIEGEAEVRLKMPPAKAALVEALRTNTETVAARLADQLSWQSKLLEQADWSRSLVAEHAASANRLAERYGLSALKAREDLLDSVTRAAQYAIPARHYLETTVAPLQANMTRLVNQASESTASSITRQWQSEASQLAAFRRPDVEPIRLPPPPPRRASEETQLMILQEVTRQTRDVETVAEVSVQQNKRQGDDSKSNRKWQWITLGIAVIAIVEPIIFWLVPH